MTKDLGLLGSAASANRKAKRLVAAEERLAATRVEMRRQSEFLGERFGVFTRMRELERQERRQFRHIEKLRSGLGPNV